MNPNIATRNNRFNASSLASSSFTGLAPGTGWLSKRSPSAFGKFLPSLGRLFRSSGSRGVLRLRLKVNLLQDGIDCGVAPAVFQRFCSQSLCVIEPKLHLIHLALGHGQLAHHEI